ncbi:MAG: hypothetical protein R3B13_08670 [Polyangiaceae bacterium]
MPSLWPSIAPRSVPLTLVPPPGRASSAALWLVGSAWLLMGAVFLLRGELADEFVRSEAWRGLLRRVLLGASGVLALSSFVPAVTGFARARLRSVAAIALSLAWCSAVVAMLMGL